MPKSGGFSSEKVMDAGSSRHRASGYFTPTGQIGPAAGASGKRIDADRQHRSRSITTKVPRQQQSITGKLSSVRQACMGA